MFNPVPDFIFDMKEEDILCYYDCPLMFFCNDLKNERYLVELQSDTGGKFVWLATRIDKDYLEELIQSDATLEFLFKENKLERTSVVIQNMSDMSVSVTELENNFEFKLSRKLKRLLEYFGNKPYCE